MKITKTLNRLLLLALLTIIISCSDNEEINSTDNMQESIAVEQEIKELNLFEDPNFISEKNNEKNADLARSGTVKVGVVTAYLNKEINATGKIYYKIRRLRDNFLVAQTGKIDVKNLATHESG